MQRSKWVVAAAGTLALVLGIAYVQAQDKPEKTGAPKAEEKEKAEKAVLPKCPVLGETVDFSVSTMTADGPVYFCCPDCIKKFTADPEKYAKGVAAQREVLKKLPRVQVTCPVSGKPIDDSVSIEHSGQKVYFCCKNCPAEFQKDPAKYKAKLEASYTYQTRCPVTGEKINPKTFTDLTTGQRIYYCCQMCDKKLLGDPAKYAPNLEAQGIKIDPKKIAAAKTEEGHEKGSEGEHKHP